MISSYSLSNLLRCHHFPHSFAVASLNFQPNQPFLDMTYVCIFEHKSTYATCLKGRSAYADLPKRNAYADFSDNELENYGNNSLLSAHAQRGLQ